jgi:hypothetical protein
MMDAPDSPPETQTTSGGPTSSFSVSNGAQQNNHLANSSKSKGDDAAKDSHGAPGSSWSSKKSRDEYDRAASLLVDRQWNQGKLS